MAFSYAEEPLIGTLIYLYNQWQKNKMNFILMKDKNWDKNETNGYGIISIN